MRYSCPQTAIYPSSGTFKSATGLIFCIIIDYMISSIVSKSECSSSYRLWVIPPPSGMKILEISKNPNYTTWRRDFVIEQLGRPRLIISNWLVNNITPPCGIEGHINCFWLELTIWPSIPRRGGIFIPQWGGTVRNLIVWHCITD